MSKPINPEMPLNGLSALSGLLSSRGYLRPLVLLSGSLNDLPIKEELLSPLSEGGRRYEILILRDGEGMSEAIRAKNAYYSRNCDCLIAIGGFEAMGIGKLAKALIASPKESPYAYEGHLRPMRKGPFLALLPTCPLGGYEYSGIALLKTPRGRAFYHSPKIMGDAVIYEPRLSFFHGEEKKDGLALALAVSLEGSLSYMPYPLKKDCLNALGICFRNAKSCLYEKNDFAALGEMAKAARLNGRYMGHGGGLALAIAGIAYVEEGPSLTETLMRVFPAILEHLVRKKPRKVARLYDSVDLMGEEEKDKAKAFVEAAKLLMASFAEGLPEASLDDNAIRNIAKRAVLAQAHVLPCAPLKKEEAEAILRAAFPKRDGK